MPLHITPPDLPDGRNCKIIKIPDSLYWSGIYTKALLDTIYPWNYEQIDPASLTPEAAAAAAYEILDEYLTTPATCAGEDLAPYWDDADADDATGEPSKSVYDYLEDLADFAVTAFLAVSFTPAAAIEFVTIARKFRLAFRSRDYGAVVRIFLDDVLFSSVDTYSAAPGIVYADVLVPSMLPPNVTLRVEHSGTHNGAATPTAAGYGMEVIRKRLDAAEMGIQDVRLTGGQIEVQRTLGGAWESITGGEVVRRDGALVPDITGQFSIAPIAATVPFVIKRPTSATTNSLALFQDEAAANLIGLDGNGALRWYSAGGGFFWTSGAFSFSLGTTRILRMQSTSIRIPVPLIFDTNPSNLIYGQLTPGWEDNVQATRRGFLSFLAGDAAGEKEFLRGSSSGTAPKLGFLGASPIIRPTIVGSDNGNLATRALLATLATYGLIVNSTTAGSATPMIILRQNPDNLYLLEQSHDAGATWTLAFNFEFLADGDGEIPPTWDIDIPITISVEAPEDTFTITDGETLADAAIRTQAFCAAIAVTVDAMLDAFVETVEDSLTVETMAAAALSLAVAILAIIPGVNVFLVLGLAIAAAALHVKVALGALITVEQAQSPELRALLSCLMYLGLKDKPISPSTFKLAFADPASCLTELEEKGTIVLNAMLNSPYGDELYMGFVQVLGSATLASRSGYELLDCAFCEDRPWCYEWRGTEALQAFFNKTGGTWSGGGLEIGATDVGGNWGAYLQMKNPIYVPPETTITMIEFYYARYGMSLQVYVLNDGDGTVRDEGNPVTEGWFTIAGSYSKSDVLLQVGAAIYTNNVVNDGYISAVRMTGTGVPMFDVCDNCV